MDADLVFDLRCLPNPYWQPDLRPLTRPGRTVVAYLEAQSRGRWTCIVTLPDFLERWIPRFEEDNRAYITIAIGCTGGQHRSVYMVEKLGAHFGGRPGGVLVRHRELGS